MQIEVTKKPDLKKIAKNVRFGVALGLTRTAKVAQNAVIVSLRTSFQLRGSWYKPNNKFGVKITPAKRNNLESAVHTQADWLVLHEDGGTKRPAGSALAVPTDNVRRNKRQIITRANRPRNIKNAFVLKTRRGPVLFQRVYANKAGRYTARKLKTNRGTRLVALFGLEKQVKIRRQSTFFDPIRSVVGKHLAENVAKSIENALETMK